MLRVSFSQLVNCPRKFIAVVLAVIIATLFLSATLIADDSLMATLRTSIGQGYGKSDLVISAKAPIAEGKGEKSAGKPVFLNSADAEALKKLAFVDNAYELYCAPAVMMTSSNDSLSVQIMSAPPENMSSLKIVEGTIPEGANQVIITTDVRDRLEIKNHDVLSLINASDPLNDIASVTGTSITNSILSQKVTVSGIVDSSATPELNLAPTILAQPSLLSTADEKNVPLIRIQAKLSPGTNLTEARERIAAALPTKNIVVNTISEQVTSDLEASLGGAQIITTFLLIFALVSLLVAIIVIYNTFSILITGRIRELALLRCIGANQQQIRNSVLLESLILGITAAGIGVALASIAMLGVISFAKNFPATSLAVFSLPLSAIIIGLITGTAMTVVAALIPAVRAARISPLAALHSEGNNIAGIRRRNGTLAIGLVMAFSGSILTLMISIADDLRGYHRIILATIGGIISFVGILMCSRLFIPRIIRSIGLVTKPCGAPGNLASLNATRNPGRTSATATALLVGVTLVTLMLTGSQGARESMDEYLDNKYPIDLTVSGPNILQENLTETMARKVENSVHGVAAAQLVSVVGKYSTGSAEETAENGGQQSYQKHAPESYVYAIAPDDARKVLRKKNIEYGVDNIFLPPTISIQEKIGVTGSGGSIALKGIHGASENLPALVTPETARKISKDKLNEVVDSPVKSQVQQNSRFASPADGKQILQTEIWVSYQDSLTEKEKIRADKEIIRLLKIQERQVVGVTAQRELFNTLIDVILFIVTALLAVAVLIALIGMANTLSLSVLERTRENSLLRALGLTKNQLRGMLTIESSLVAFVAALAGIILGMVYGNLAVQAIFGSHTSGRFIVAWIPVLIVLATALVSGLLASLLPSRRATRLSPVQGLAIE